MSSSKPCSVCGTLTINRCSICKIDYYCSKECQLMVHKTHHKICKAGSSFFVPSPPSKDINIFVKTAVYGKKTIFEGPSYYPFMPQLKSIRLFDGSPEELVKAIEENTIEEPRRSFILFLLYDRVSINDPSGRKAPGCWHTFALFFARIIDTLIPHYLYQDPSTRRSLDDFAVLAKKLIIFYDLLEQYDLDPPGPEGLKDKLDFTNGELLKAFSELPVGVDEAVRGRIRESVMGASSALMTSYLKDLMQLRETRHA